MPKRKTFAEATKRPIADVEKARPSRIQWSTLLRPELASALTMKAAQETIRTGKRASVADLVERFIEEGLGRMK